MSWRGEYLITYYSLKPKIGKIECLVPNCNRSWTLKGSNQGCMISAVSTHCYAHWSKFHEKQKHPKAIWKTAQHDEVEGHEFCQICKDICESEYQQRIEEKK